MDEFLKILDSLIPVLAAIGGAFIGGHFTRKTQNDLVNLQRQLEERKEERQNIKDALSVYNNILKIDGEEMVISHIGGPEHEFEIECYQDKVRPIIYEKYHLIHADVAKLVRRMDDIIQKCNYYEEVSKEDNAFLMRNYNLMIKNIRQHIYDFRSDK
ncbi:hypothetical protein GLW20_02375 [Virgibacillus halodenitrificans]|nr:hypothetical protein [Virgibacillus halodenitrificans]